ncbi:glycosyl transferase family 2 [Rhodanobacter sp. Root561]|uniref:glycosyltransferase family 2 protein n=1 Tax=Rhodanobacter sp. Root561 TaxID=1736560 RepID=UPI0007008EFB|nr:glycosyltransferase family 2 protein [Rhodanobacter sp. Root561]KQZ79455.1 glycosyl transferase family 2 [Rhodanobacter sp. Root561]
MNHPSGTTPVIAVVIPCYRVGSRVLDVIRDIGPEVGWIFVVDDACPEHSGKRVTAECGDPRVQVLEHGENQGVGGATVSGYKAALATEAQIVVKLDGDGQMAPALIPNLVRSIRQGRADYVKGNRFYRIGDVSGMPAVRLIGNAGLSFLTKLSSGYWQLFDPTNGFTAIQRDVLAEMNLDKLARRYFFESDMLYNLNQLRAVVGEMPMPAVYADEPSSLRPMRVIGHFFRGNLRNFLRRVVYTYFVRSFSLATIELLLSLPLILFGLCYGLAHWAHAMHSGVPAASGVVMAAALPLIIGTQLLLSWLNYDVSNQPTQPVHPMLAGRADGS